MTMPDPLLRQVVGNPQPLPGRPTLAECVQHPQLLKIEERDRRNAVDGMELWLDQRGRESALTAPHVEVAERPPTNAREWNPGEPSGLSQGVDTDGEEL